MNNKFQKGDKVRIISKSRGCPLEQSNVYKRGGGIGYVGFMIDCYGKRCILVSEKRAKANVGDYFTHEDLESYDDKPTIDDMFDDIIDTL